MKVKKTPNAWSAACFSLHYVICDGCGIGCDGKGFSRKDALYLAKKDDWKQIGEQILCGTCQAEGE